MELHPAPGLRVAVAGGCGGIGRAVVAALLDCGGRVTVLDLAASAARHPVPEGVGFVACDAREEGSVTAAFDGLGPLDAFVNLVGYTNERRLLEDMPAAEWDELMGGNLRGAFLLNRAAIPLVRAGGESGRIVNFTSTFGVRVALPGYSAYAAAKAGIISMTQALAVECGPAIRVNAIAPGLTDTDFLRGGLSRPEKSVKIDPVAYGQTLPLKRAGRPEDLARAVLFLLGPGGDWITGQTLHVNGGLWP